MAVIFYLKYHAAFVLITADYNGASAPLIFNSMVERVFNDWLKQHFQNPFVQDLLLNDDPVIQNILVSDFLDLQIAFDVAFSSSMGIKSEPPERTVRKKSLRSEVISTTFWLSPSSAIQTIESRVLYKK